MRNSKRALSVQYMYNLNHTYTVSCDELTCNVEMAVYCYWIAVALLIRHCSVVLAQGCEDPFTCFEYNFGTCSDEDWPANGTDNSEEEGFVCFPF